MNGELRAVCVYAGSSPGVDPEFTVAAAALGRSLALRGMTLVYGGSNVGLMGTVADAALAAGGHVIGILPEVLRAKEVAHQGLDELLLVGSMHERKLAMMERADAFVALPGGAGTLEELFETFTWLQLGLHRKPIGLLDVHGYWDSLMSFLGHAVDERLLSNEHAAMLLVDERPDALLDRFSGWVPPALPKWLDRETV